jgi:hypothetical protein
MDGHKFYKFDGMSRSNEKEIHSRNFKKAPMKRLERTDVGNMPGTTIPLATANRATDSRNNYLSANPPDVIRMTKGLKIIGVA